MRLNLSLGIVSSNERIKWFENTQKIKARGLMGLRKICGGNVPNMLGLH